MARLLNSCFSHRAPGFDSQNPNISYQPFITSVPGDPLPPSDLHGHEGPTRSIQICRQNINRHKINQSLENILEILKKIHVNNKQFHRARQDHTEIKPVLQMEKVEPWKRNRPDQNLGRSCTADYVQSKR